jgi:hypothetical protein
MGEGFSPAGGTRDKGDECRRAHCKLKFCNAPDFLSFEDHVRQPWGVWQNAANLFHDMEEKWNLERCTFANLAICNFTYPLYIAL